MHIPDGFLSTPVWASLDLLTLPAVGYVAKRAQNSSHEGTAPLLGVLGAFVFVVQTINFPVAPGTSAHLLGGALLGCAVGPLQAIVVMTAVLVIQAFIFQDGGILALGAIFNLGIVGVLAGYAPYHIWGAGRARSFAVFLGGVMSVVASGLFALLQLALSGVALPSSLVSVALGFFAVSAVLEGFLTLAVIVEGDRANQSALGTT